MVLLAPLPVVARSRPARRGPYLDGPWQGSVTANAGGNAGTAVSALTQHGARIKGTMTVDAGDIHATFTVTGRARGSKVRLRGRLRKTRLAWRGSSPDAAQTTWRGPLAVRGGGRRMRGMLELRRGSGARCGDDYFASDVMPRVFQPVCTQCHVEGGAAASAPFRVTIGDAAATLLSALREVDTTDPLQSKILRKPLGDLPHGGGRQIVAGSAEEQVLVEWLSRLTAPGCEPPGGDGGGGNPTTGAALYAEHCASCHGASGRGDDTHPAILCALDVTDAVVNGRGTAMPGFPLTSAEVVLINAHLDGLCTASGRTGADLFASNCQTCHGADAHGGQNALGVEGTDVHCNRDVSDAVKAGRPPEMPPFTAMTDADVASLQEYVDALCPAGTATGADLFAGNCARCHGEDARGVADRGPSVRCSKNIADPVRNGRPDAVPSMPSFPLLPGGEIALIQGFLNGLCPPGSAGGTELYAANCASCHGADAAGLGEAPDVRCATRIDDAVLVGRGDAMPAFGSMAGPDLASITTRLGTLCTQNGRTGASLYAGNCSTCHGATAQGGQNALGVSGPDVACTGEGDYQEKVQFGDDEMPAFPALSAGDVSAIVTYVHGAFCAD